MNKFLLAIFFHLYCSVEGGEKTGFLQSIKKREADEVQRFQDWVKKEKSKVVGDIQFDMVISELEEVLGGTLVKSSKKEGFSQAEYYKIAEAAKGGYEISLSDRYTLGLNEIAFYKKQPWLFTFSINLLEGITPSQDEHTSILLFIRKVLEKKFVQAVTRDFPLPFWFSSKELIKFSQNKSKVNRPFDNDYINKKLHVEWVVGSSQSELQKVVCVTDNTTFGSQNAQQWCEVHIVNLNILNELKSATVSIDPSKVF